MSRNNQERRDTPDLEGVASELLSCYDWSHLPVGRELSGELLPETSQQCS